MNPTTTSTEQHAGMDGPVQDAVLRLGRYLRQGEVSEDLRTVQIGRAHV